MPADNFVPPGIAGYEKGAWADSKYDVEAAKKALADAGFPEGKGAPELKLSYNSDGGHEKIMELVQADLQGHRLRSRRSTRPTSPTYLKQLDAGKFQIGRLGWIADYPIVDNFLYSMFKTRRGDNKSKYTNPSRQGARRGSRRSPTPPSASPQYQEINKTIGDEPRSRRSCSTGTTTLARRSLTTSRTMPLAMVDFDKVVAHRRRRRSRRSAVRHSDVRCDEGVAGHPTGVLPPRVIGARE